jgi:LAO/AO transport system kinase
MQKLSGTYRDYLERFLDGEILAASRLMSVVERGGADAEEILNSVFPHAGRAYRVGITGLTGAGKSSLVNKLARHCRSQSRTVGVVAEDPSSPFSGGAILGDRVRMHETSGDAGVFIRSIASRGSETGFSTCAAELADVLDAFGRDVIFLETIGVGQLEYKIHFSAHTTVVVLTPDAGDDVQGLKSGLMEIGEIFAVNKADRPQAKRFAEDLRSILELRGAVDGWAAPVVETVATTGDGVAELYGEIERHRLFLESDGRMERKRLASLRSRMTMVAEEKLKELLWENESVSGRLDEILADVAAGQKSPYQGAAELLAPIRIEKEKGSTR